MGLAITLGIYILAATYIIRLLMRIPKKPMYKRMVLYLCLLPAILIPILMQNPLLLVYLIGYCAYISLAIFITRLLMRFPKEAQNKRIVMYLGIFTAILIPYWDVLLLDWKSNQLCEAEAGIHVYEKVALGPEYWKEDGTLNFPKDRRLEDVLPEEFERVFILEKDIFIMSEISKGRYQVKRKKDRKIIGEVISFSRGGGWVSRFAGVGGGGLDCPEPGVYTHFAEAVFKQKSE